jgi:hypothetical protein
MYKERGQLQDRKHLGLILEKHKDYKRRSLNFKQKDRVISKLNNFLNTSFRKAAAKGRLP